MKKKNILLLIIIILLIAIALWLLILYFEATIFGAKVNATVVKNNVVEWFPGTDLDDKIPRKYSPVWGFTYNGKYYEAIDTIRYNEPFTIDSYKTIFVHKDDPTKIYIVSNKSFLIIGIIVFCFALLVLAMLIEQMIRENKKSPKSISY